MCVSVSLSLSVHVCVFCAFSSLPFYYICRFMYQHQSPHTDTECFHPHRDPLCYSLTIIPTSFLLLTPPQPLATTHLYFISIILPSQECYINGTIHWITFWDWLCSLSFNLIGFTQVSNVFIIFFHCWVVFRAVDGPQFVQPFTHGRVPALFPVCG